MVGTQEPIQSVGADLPKISTITNDVLLGLIMVQAHQEQFITAYEEQRDGK